MHRRQLIEERIVNQRNTVCLLMIRKDVPFLTNNNKRRCLVQCLFIYGSNVCGVILVMIFFEF